MSLLVTALGGTQIHQSLQSQHPLIEHISQFRISAAVALSLQVLQRQALVGKIFRTQHDRQLTQRRSVFCPALRRQLQGADRLVDIPIEKGAIDAVEKGWNTIPETAVHGPE
ncbi:hypothetical protein D9M69_515730 [compost metagenome]